MAKDVVPEGLDVVMAFCRARHYPEGVDVVCRGEAVRNFGVILEGSLAQCVVHGKRQVVIGTLGPGAVIGAEGVFGLGDKATVTLRALERSEIASIDHLHLEHHLSTRLAQARPAVLQAAGRAMVEQNAAVSSALRSVAFETVEQRILAVLKNPHRWCLPEPDDRGFIPFPRQEMSQRLGTSREVVARAVARLASQGVAELDGIGVRILPAGTLPQPEGKRDNPAFPAAAG